MAVTKFLARDLVIEISTGVGTDTIAGTADDTWTPIGGLNSLTHAPSTNRVDMTDFDSNGRQENMATSRGETWSLSGHAKEDVTDGSRDAGQAAVEALAKLIGPTSLGHFRITTPGGNIIMFAATAEVSQMGGGHNDLAAWSASLEVSGTPTYVPAP